MLLSIFHKKKKIHEQDSSFNNNKLNSKQESCKQESCKQESYKQENENNYSSNQNFIKSNIQNYNLKCKNMNQELKDLYNINQEHSQEIKNNSQSDIIDLVDDWIKPPEKYGLENSDRIFGQYYLTHKNLTGKIFDIDFLYTITDDIKNFRKLSKYQLSFINNVDHETKFMIINEFNNALNALVESLE